MTVSLQRPTSSWAWPTGIDLSTMTMTLCTGQQSIEVIERRMAVLNEQMKEAEGSPTEYEKEIEELKELLPEIREKIEDAKESQRSGNVAELALKATLVGLVSF